MEITKKEYPRLETDRLKLRILTKDHAMEVFKHFSDPFVTRYMDIEPCRNLKEAEEIIQYHEDDLGCRWGIFEKARGCFIGTIGFHYLRKTDETFIAEIGFDLSKDYWGKGYVTEAVNEVISFGFSNIGLQKIDATVEPENQKSIKLMTKLGFNKGIELKDELIYFSLEKGSKLGRG